MANRIPPDPGLWLRLEELLEQGSFDFVDQLRQISDADRLGEFAKPFFGDKRPTSRKLLLAYLQTPLNAFRHEAFVKRLFKLAEFAADDEVMAYYMVALDRSIRRIRKSRYQYDWSTRESWSEEYLTTPRHTEMPKNYNPHQLSRPDGSRRNRQSEDEKLLALFSLPTRKYLRRRVWRYFRKVAKVDPDRYARSMRIALSLYTDQDCVDGLAMLDNWSMTHAMFGRSDVITSKSRSWKLVEGHGLSELKCAPVGLEAWKKNSEALLELLDDAKTRPVRQWSITLLREYHSGSLNNIPVDRLLQWIRSEDSELARFAAERLENSPQRGTLRVGTWMDMIREANADVMDVVCNLMRATLSHDAVNIKEAVEMACGPNVPIAELGLTWLEAKTPRNDDDFANLYLALDAQTDIVRPKLAAVVRNKLDAVESKRAESILAFLDARHADVRSIGWDWILARPEVGRSPQLWQSLAETPYDDVRFQLLERMQYEVDTYHSRNKETALKISEGALSPDRIRYLWATALLNIHRGGKRKPAIVSSIVERLQNHPDESNELLPILAIALRSSRSLEWQAGLVGIVQMVEQNPGVSEAVGAHFPELRLV